MINFGTGPFCKVEHTHMFGYKEQPIKMDGTWIQKSRCDICGLVREHLCNKNVSDLEEYYANRGTV